MAPVARNLGNYRGTGEIAPIVNRTFEWGVAIATFLSVLSFVARNTRSRSPGFHPSPGFTGARLFVPVLKTARNDANTQIPPSHGRAGATAAPMCVLGRENHRSAPAVQESTCSGCVGTHVGCCLQAPVRRCVPGAPGPGGGTRSPALRPPGNCGAGSLQPPVSHGAAESTPGLRTSATGGTPLGVPSTAPPTVRSVPACFAVAALDGKARHPNGPSLP